MSEYVIRVDENDERWHYVEQQYTHFFGYPITEQIVRCRDCKYYDELWTSEVYPNRHWCDKLTVYMPPNGFCSFGKRRWLTCKCGEEIETTGGAFVVCPNCGARVIAGD